MLLSSGISHRTLCHCLPLPSAPISCLDIPQSSLSLCLRLCVSFPLFSHTGYLYHWYMSLHVYEHLQAVAVLARLLRWGCSFCIAWSSILVRLRWVFVKCCHSIHGIAFSSTNCSFPNSRIPLCLTFLASVV